jgi:hypothetical protein
LAHKGKADEKTVLFLMPDLGEVESLLKFKLPHKKWLKYYESLYWHISSRTSSPLGSWTVTMSPPFI